MLGECSIVVRQQYEYIAMEMLLKSYNENAGFLCSATRKAKRALVVSSFTFDYHFPRASLRGDGEIACLCNASRRQCECEVPVRGVAIKICKQLELFSNSFFDYYFFINFCMLKTEFFSKKNKGNPPRNSFKRRLKCCSLAA